MEKKLPESIYIPKEFSPSSGVLSKAKLFIKEFKTFETKNGIPLLLLFDNRSEAFYLICHLESKLLSTKSDFDAVLDPLESEEYKLNRNIYTDNNAYKLMATDALQGRSFHEYDEIELDEYRSKIRMGLSAIIEIIDCLCRLIIEKPLRQKIKDLIL